MKGIVRAYIFVFVLAVMFVSGSYIYAEDVNITLGTSDGSDAVRMKSSDSSPLMDILSSGNVGIGTSSPTEKLDVVGNIKATAFIGDGSSLTGISGGGSGAFTDTGSSAYYTGGNVGIGTTSPRET